MGTVRLPLVAARVRWLAVVAVGLAILVASLSPSTGATAVRGPLGVVGADKYLHALGFAAFALALAYALAARDPTLAAVAVLCATVAFGLLVELLQIPLATRTFSLLDLVADAAGATVVALTWRFAAARVRFRPVDRGESTAGQRQG